MTELREDDMLVRLAVDDARTTEEAGARFAHALAGIGSADFMVALAEQEDLIRRTITDAGHSAEQARLAAAHFETAAKVEWERIASAGSTSGEA